MLITVLAMGLVAWWGGNRYWRGRTAEEGAGDAVLYEVARDDFLLAVTERGEIRSAGLTEIRSDIKTKNNQGISILRIIPEGTLVAEGDFLVELDSTALKDEHIAQQISCNAAEALVIEARNVYETAVIAEREYLEGTYVEARQTIESEVFVAEEDLNRAKEYYQYSKKLAVKGYVNDLQLEADQFAVEKSRKELEAAKTKLKVLDEFTKAKTLKELSSNILIAKAKWEANKNSYRIELDKLHDLEDQITKCTISAPKEGVVIYAHERNRFSNDNFTVEEGATVRERQVILNIPDSTSMEVEINVNESLIEFVKKGMPATITPVGMGDVVLQGTVQRVNRFAEPTGWRKANIKEYKAYVLIKDAPAELRSGLTASVTIQCAFVQNAMKVPVQGVYAHGDQFFCLTHGATGWSAQEVTCGPTNDKFFVIESGLQEGDRVALNPRQYLSEVALPVLPPEQQQRAVPYPQGPAPGGPTAKPSSNQPPKSQPPAGKPPGRKPQAATT